MVCHKLSLRTHHNHCNKITGERRLGTRQTSNNHWRRFYKRPKHFPYRDDFISSHNLFDWWPIETVWRKLMFITLGPDKVKLYFTHTSRWTVPQLREKVLGEILKRTRLNTINWKRILHVTVTKCIPNKSQTLTHITTQPKALLVRREIHIRHCLVPLIPVQESKKSWRTASMCTQLPLNLTPYTWNEKR